MQPFLWVMFHSNVVTLGSRNILKGLEKFKRFGSVPFLFKTANCPKKPHISWRNISKVQTQKMHTSDLQMSKVLKKPVRQMEVNSSKEIFGYLYAKTNKLIMKVRFSLEIFPTRLRTKNFGMLLLILVTLSMSESFGRNKLFRDWESRMLDLKILKSWEKL